MARRDDDGRRRGIRPRAGHLSPPAGARGVPDARGHAEQSGRDDAVRRRPRRGRGSHRRMLPRGRRRPLLRVRALPRDDGRRERADGRRRSDRLDPAARARPLRSPRSGHRRARRGLRQRSRADYAGAQLPEEPVHGLRPLGGGRLERAARGRASGPRRTCASRRAT